MKVLIQGRSELLTHGGGDKVQIENTALELRKLGVTVDISTDLNTDVSSYDLVHIFQLDWTPETYFYAKNAKSQGKKVVLSPIHHSLKEVKKFDDNYVFGFRRIAKFLFGDQHNRDTFKNIYRAIFDFNKIEPTVKSIFLGLEKMHKKTLEMSDVVLVQTEAEAHDLIETYGVQINWRKIPNGVGRHFLGNTQFQNKFNFSDYIVCVGRIEPRKNQLNIIKAVEELRNETKQDIKLVLIGQKSVQKHFEFIFWFNLALQKNKWITHLESVPYIDMPSIYKFAKVCVSASWFETTGLTSLEALFCGTNAVAAGDRAREYLSDMVSYCQPDDVNSIKSAIKKEYFASRPTPTSEMVGSYTWENAAKLTFDVYNLLRNPTL